MRECLLALGLLTALQWAYGGEPIARLKDMRLRTVLALAQGDVRGDGGQEIAVACADGKVRLVVQTR